MVIPKTSQLISAFIRESHNTGGHGGPLKTYKNIFAQVYWEGMKNDVYRFVAACLTCQRNKYLSLFRAGLLQPLPIPQEVWDDITMDFIEGMP